MQLQLRFLVFFGVFTSLVGGLHYYLWLRLARDPALPTPLLRLVTALLIGLALSMPLSMALSRTLQSDALRPLFFGVFVWMGMGFIFSALFFATDLGRWLSHGAMWLMAHAGGSETPVDPARRLLISRAIALGVGGTTLGVTAWGMKTALAGVQVVPQHVKLKGLPQALDGFKLVQISDVHIGPLLRKEWLSGIVDRIEALKPDAVVITGDLVDGSVEELRAHVEPLARLKPPQGVFFVTGNHEYYSGWREWVAHLPSLGVRPLRNERVELAKGLHLAGIHDPSMTGTNESPDLDKALAGKPAGEPVVLLAHQPKQFKEAALKGVDLTLSGHTHGGQIFPFTFLVRLQQPWVAGRYTEGASQLYVSRGTGFWGPPLRVMATPEITLLTLAPA